MLHDPAVRARTPRRLAQPRRATLTSNTENENPQRNNSNRFIIRILDDTHVWIKSDRLEWVQHEVRVFNESNVYTPPVVLGEGAEEGAEDEDEDEDEDEE